MLIKLENGFPIGNPVTPENFRKLFPNVSFPAILTPEVVEPHGFGVFCFSAAPNPTRYEKIVEGAPVKNSAGLWEQVWNLVEMSDEEKQVEDSLKAAVMRDDRNKRLADCDWTQLADSPLDADAKLAWALYRETLRMVPQQAGFPWEISWPPEPGTV